MNATGETSAGLASEDLAAWWMPFTANRAFKQQPRLLTAAQGMYYTSASGQRILDGTAGLWCVNAGHARPSLSAAIAAQLEELDYAPPFQMGHPGGFELAARLAEMMPGDLNHVFFSNSGSEAVDTALKIALAYQRARGEGRRIMLIGRERAYHGVGFGGMSVGGIAANRCAFGPLLPAIDHLSHTYDPETQRHSRGQPEFGVERANDLERLVALHDASTIAAVIVEPMAGSTGVLPPPRGYLERLREITRRHGIVLIFDEVITAFGRVGYSSAAERLGILPDIMATAKALTNGVIPMGATLVRSEIHDAVMGTSVGSIELFHGYTYSAHPVACAAAAATLDIYEQEKLFERARRLEDFWAEKLHSLADAPHVFDTRSWGLVGAVQLQPGDSLGSRGMAAFLECLRRGALVRVTGDTIALSPPLVISEDEIGLLFDILRSSLESMLS